VYDNAAILALTHFYAVQASQDADDAAAVPAIDNDTSASMHEQVGVDADEEAKVVDNEAVTVLAPSRAAINLSALTAVPAVDPDHRPARALNDTSVSDVVRRAE
jgi:hypothetical protein